MPIKQATHVSRYPLLFISLLFIIIIYVSVPCYGFDFFTRSDDPPQNAIIQLLPDGDADMHSTIVVPLKKPRVAGLRIHISMEDIKNISRYCAPGDDINKVRRPTFRGFDFPCENIDIMTSAKQIILRRDIIPNAIKIHSQWLRVRRSIEPLKIPQFDKGSCQYFKVPENHESEGISFADYVLYVAAGPYLLFAEPCAFFDKSFRPFAGVINYSPRFIDSTRHAVQRALHEITHALGFYWPLIIHLGFGEEKNGKKYLTDKAVETIKVSQKYFNCTFINNNNNNEDNINNIKNMLIEDETHDGEIHWEGKIFKDELMAAELSDTAALSVMTIALFKDLGFFKPIAIKAEHMTWGKGAGCDFLNINCRAENNYENNNKEKFSKMFCSSQKEHKQCTTDRLAVGKCDSLFYGNGCSVIKPEEIDYCIDLTINAETGNKRCVERVEKPGGQSLPPQCIETKCDTEKKKLYVRNSHEEEFKICEKDKTVTDAEGKYLICPNFEEICPPTRESEHTKKKEQKEE